ncbi:MAG: hypothetical protein ACFCD0_10535 [Gemmataceae bacterium]
MTKYIALASLFAAALFLNITPTQAGGEGEKKVMCVVAKRAINKAQFVKFNGGKVYFCCGNCKAKFMANNKKFIAKANHQLVMTGQAVQKKCPYSGRGLNPETKISIAGADVCFCCNNCKGKTVDAKLRKQINMIFNNKSFKKGFVVKSAE